MFEADLDIDLEEDEEEQQPEHERLFSLATEHVTRHASVYDSGDLLQLYALYKQATDGPCTGPRPSVLQMKARSKWNAWYELGDMSTVDAQRAYIEKLHKLDPKWLDIKLCGDGGSAGGGANRQTGWVVHSIESAPVESSKPEHQKTVFDYVKENNLERLRELLKKADLDQLDDQGMALLHWATDRNASEIIEYLVSQGADVNLRDEEQQTPLHYAASCGHVEAVRSLLALNADLELTDADGQSCIDVADDEHICAMLQAELQRRKLS